MARRTEAIVDASVAIKWLSEEEGTQDALKLREEHITGTTILSAPDLLIYELANALRHKPDFDEERVTRAISDIIDLQLDLIAPGKELVEQSINAAYKYGITVYDSIYLALGELMGVEIYTSDRKFYEKAKGSGVLKLI